MIKMRCITEYDEAETMRMFKEEGREEGRAEALIELGREAGLDDTMILNRIQEKIGWTLKDAEWFLEQYGKRNKVKNMCITEYNEAETMRMFKEEGEDKLGQLIDILLANKRMEDARKAAVDKDVRRKLYEEFQI